MRPISDAKRLTDSGRAVLDRCQLDGELDMLPMQALMANTNGLALLALRHIGPDLASDLMHTAVETASVDAVDGSVFGWSIDSRLNLLRLRAMRDSHRASAVLDVLDKAASGDGRQLAAVTRRHDRPGKLESLNPSERWASFFALVEIGFRVFAESRGTDSVQWATSVTRKHAQLVWSGAFQPLELLRARGYAVRMPAHAPRDTKLKWDFIDWNYRYTEPFGERNRTGSSDMARQVADWWSAIDGGEVTFISPATKFDWLHRLYELAPTKGRLKTLISLGSELDYEHGMKRLFARLPPGAAAARDEIAVYLDRRVISAEEVQACAMAHMDEMNRRLKDRT